MNRLLPAAAGLSDDILAPCSTDIPMPRSSDIVIGPCGLPLPPETPLPLSAPLGGTAGSAAELSGFEDEDEDYGDSESVDDGGDDEFEDFDDIDDDDFDDEFDDDFEEELEDDYEIEIEDEISAEFGLSGQGSGDDDEEAAEDLEDIDDEDDLGD